MPENETQEPQNADAAETDESQVDWKAKAREWEKRAKQNTARIAELEPKATQFDALEQASKTDLERFQEKLAETQREAEAARSDAIRFRVASEFSITPEDVDLLGSGTEEEIRGRAQRIAAMKAVNGPRKPAPDASQGSSATGRSSDNDAASWLQQLTRGH